MFKENEEVRYQECSGVIVFVGSQYSVMKVNAESDRNSPLLLIYHSDFDSKKYT